MGPVPHALTPATEMLPDVNVLPMDALIALEPWPLLIVIFDACQE
jgi:hypothetical protein